MSRCTNCNRFVPNGEPRAELQWEEICEKTVAGEVYVAIPCEECGSDLKEAYLDFEFEIHHDCPKDIKPEFVHDIEIENIDVSPSDRYEDKDKKGKPIKNFRYMKHFYGADITINYRCKHCNQSNSQDEIVEEMASAFEESC